MDLITYWAGKATADSERSLSGTTTLARPGTSPVSTLAGAEKGRRALLAIPVLLATPVLLMVSVGEGKGVPNPKVGAGGAPNANVGAGAGFDSSSFLFFDTSLLFHILGQLITQRAVTSSFLEWQSWTEDTDISRYAICIC